MLIALCSVYQLGLRNYVDLDHNIVLCLLTCEHIVLAYITIHF